MNEKSIAMIDSEEGSADYCTVYSTTGSPTHHAMPDCSDRHLLTNISYVPPDNIKYSSYNTNEAFPSSSSAVPFSRRFSTSDSDEMACTGGLLQDFAPQTVREETEDREPLALNKEVPFEDYAKCSVPLSSESIVTVNIPEDQSLYSMLSSKADGRGAPSFLCNNSPLYVQNNRNDSPFSSHMLSSPSWKSSLVHILGSQGGSDSLGIDVSSASFSPLAAEPGSSFSLLNDNSNNSLTLASSSQLATHIPFSYCNALEATAAIKDISCDNIYAMNNCNGNLVSAEAPKERFASEACIEVFEIGGKTSTPITITSSEMMSELCQPNVDSRVTFCVASNQGGQNTTDVTHIDTNAAKIVYVSEREPTAPIKYLSNSQSIIDELPTSSSYSLQSSAIKHKSSGMESLECKRPKSKQSNAKKTTSDRLLEIPRVADSKTITVDGKKVYSCSLCGLQFKHEYQYQRHQISHTNEKRGALTLKNKLDIIERAQKGEKYVDIAMHYSIGRSTLTAILKDADRYISISKTGKYNDSRKRFRAAGKGDVEDALFLWYSQAIDMGMAVSGPILCSKAKDFAIKLGHPDFKATNGWLHRFKTRKNITLTRPRNVKDSATAIIKEGEKDFADVLLPRLMLEFEQCNIFYGEQFGVLYSAQPHEYCKYKNIRCVQGSLGHKRLTVLVATNMTSEKFPLLVVGSCRRTSSLEALASLHIQYSVNDNAWLTSEQFDTWIHNMDNWFWRKSRKILLIVPSSPVFQTTQSLRAIKLLPAPRSFTGPVKLGIRKSVKQIYRRSLLELLVEEADNCASNANLLPIQALGMLSSAWHSTSLSTITNSFIKAGLSKFSPWANSSLPDQSLSTENLELLHVLKRMDRRIAQQLTFNDFVTFDDNLQTCPVMNDEDIIEVVTSKDCILESDEESSDLPSGSDGSCVDCPQLVANVQKTLPSLQSFVEKHSSPELTSIYSHLRYLVNRSIEHNHTRHC